MEEFFTYLKTKGTDVALNLLLGLVILIIGLKIAKLIVKALSKGKAFQKMDKGAQSFLMSFVKVVLYAVVISSAAIVWGVPSTTFVTLFTSAGVAIGLALQGSLSNLAGGLMILVFHPFKVGDYIEGSGCAGTVTDITVIYTILTTPDNRVITIPNGSLTNANITNFSKLDIRRVDLTPTASYEAGIDEVRDVLLNVAKSHKLVLQDPEPFVKLSKNNDSSLEYTFRVWCKNADYWTVYFDCIENIKKAFDEKGIEIPYNKLDVNIISKENAN